MLIQVYHHLEFARVAFAAFPSLRLELQKFKSIQWSDITSDLWHHRFLMSCITSTSSEMSFFFFWLHLFIATVKNCLYLCVFIAQPHNRAKDKHYILKSQTLQLPFQNLQHKLFFFREERRGIWLLIGGKK